MKKLPFIILAVITILLIVKDIVMGFPYTLPFTFDKTYYEENSIYQGQHYSIYSPYIERDNRYKVQLHTHTTNSDGQNTPQELMTAYKNAGYDAVAITDHNIGNPDPNVDGILWLPGVEGGGSLMHILRLNVSENVPSMVDQDTIDITNMQNGLTGLAHTFGGGGWYETIETLSSLKDFQFVEIENWAVRPVFLNDYPLGELLSLGYHIWAIGVDDCHGVSGEVGDYCFNKCFVEVMANELNPSAIFESLREGNFYVRETGAPQITLTMDGNTIFCTSDVEASFEFLCRDNLILLTNFGTSASYTIKGWEGFVRVRVNNGKYSWTQPVWIDN
jgi:hypothetical protein